MKRKITPLWPVVLGAILVIIIIVAAGLSLADGRSCCSDRAVLTAGVKAAHKTLVTGQMEWDGHSYRTCQDSVKLAIKQMEDSARAAGVEMEAK